MKERIVELIKYGFWGVVSVGINLGLFYLMVHLGVQYVAANVISYILAVVCSYFFNRYLVFQKADTGRSQIAQGLKYFAMRAVSVAVDSGLLVFLHAVCGLNVTVSKVIDSVIIIGGTFVISKLFIFR